MITPSSVSTTCWNHANPGHSTLSKRPLSEGARHKADVAEIERTYDDRRTEIAIHRCGTRGQLYRWEHYELNDWSGGGDYCDDTYVWKVPAPDEMDAVRRDPNYRPRDGRERVKSDSIHLFRAARVNEGVV